MNYKKIMVLLKILIVLTVVFTIVGIIYYNSKDKVKDETPEEVVVPEKISESLVFDECDPIYLSISDENDLTSTIGIEKGTCVKAILTADSNTFKASYNYDVSFEITENGFEYTTDNNSIELLLQVIDPNGKEIKEIDGLTYDKKLKGFDVTNKIGLYKIITNKTIKVSKAAENPKNEQWDFKVQFITVGNDQSINIGKDFQAVAKIQKN